MLQQTVETLAALSIRKVQRGLATIFNPHADHVLFRALLAYPEGTTDNPDFTRIPVFERLCALLNETISSVSLSSVSLQQPHDSYCSLLLLENLSAAQYLSLHVPTMYST
jgi:hypothetical protein